MRVAVVAAEQPRRPAGLQTLPNRSHRAMSMPLMACSTAPPRPCQKVLCRSFSVTRSGSSADSPISSGRSSSSAGLDERLAGVDAADAADALVGEHLDQGVQVLLRLDVVVPAALRRTPHQRDRADLADLHRRRLPRSGRAYHATPTADARRRTGFRKPKRRGPRAMRSAGLDAGGPRSGRPTSRAGAA